MDRDELLKATQEFFFCAMPQGYLGNVPKLVVPDKPDFKRLTVTAGDFELQDEYYIRLGTRFSFGETQIWYKEQLVWYMRYEGKYEKRAIPLLKDALRCAIAKKRFIGGRGDYVHTCSQYPHLIYYNVVRQETFSRFWGQERIMDTDTSMDIGTHEYWGRFLL